MSGFRSRNTGLSSPEHFKDDQINDSDKHLDFCKSNRMKNVDIFNPDKRIYIEPECYYKLYSTYGERINQTPKEISERGYWENIRGESKFIPNDEKIIAILKKFGLDGIEYKNGIPDFSKISKQTLEIDNMTENRYNNFRQCDEKCAEEWNKQKKDGRTDWTAEDVAKWRNANGYTWHERNDMKTCDLIPIEINDYFGHLGGVSECRKYNEKSNQNNGGDFDE